MLSDIAVGFGSKEDYGFGRLAMEKVKICASCGAAADSGRLFCSECGARLPADNLFQAYKKKHRYCTICDTVVFDAALFCPICGAKLK